MKPLLFLLLFASVSSAQPPAFHPESACVRIQSHGASGTIIGTSRDKSYILGCAHMLEDARGNPSPTLLSRKFTLDGPIQPFATRKLAAVRLLAWDHRLDLSLLEIDNGPFHFVPVAPPGHVPSKRIRSLGYDDMKWPAVNRPATLLFSGPTTTYTREKPWHGRSGGGLIDVDKGCLIGVVQGYETGGAQRGVYVSHSAVLLFLNRHRPSLVPKPFAASPCPSNR